MSVIACDIPAASVLDRETIKAAWFRDSWKAPTAHPNAAITDVYFAVFDHRPLWMKRLMRVRNWLVSPFGIKTPTARQIMDPQILSHYRVGDTIGAWPIYALTANELVAGRDNTHLDFRVSIFRSADSVVISTVCVVHNTFGKIYLACIKPFHKWGIRKLIADAVRANRL